jgi:hypothetical protein
MNKKIPIELKNKQEQVRQETVNKVLHAIKELQSEGYIVKIKDLIEYTGLSRSTFAKSHVRDILVTYDIVSISDKSTRVVDKTVKSPVDKQKLIIKKKDERIGRLLEENEELKREIELLRGKVFLMKQRLNS